MEASAGSHSFHLVPEIIPWNIANSMFCVNDPSSDVYKNKDDCFPTVRL